MQDRAIRLCGSTEFIELSVLEIVGEDTPASGDLRLGVSVSCNEFSGKYEDVWIGAESWGSFIGSLQRLERERTGAASVESLSPGEFQMTLQIVDVAGHLVVHGFLSRYHFGHPFGKATRSRIEYHFDVDPSLLRGFVDSFPRQRVD